MNYKDRVWRFKARLVARALRMVGGNPRAAAALLELDRSAFYVLMKRCGLKPPSKRAAGKQYFGVNVAP